MIHPRMGEAKARLILQNSRPVWKYLSERVRLLPVDQLSIFQPKYSSSFIYYQFKLYCAEQGIRPEAPNTFYKELREYFAGEPGITFSTSGSRHHYSGLILMDTPPDPTYNKSLLDGWISTTIDRGITGTKNHFDMVIWLMFIDRFFRGPDDE